MSLNMSSNVSSEQDLPLPLLFQRALNILKQLEAAPASAPATQQLVARGRECLRAAAAAADALSLFSANEDRDDLATADIKYLLIPFYQAEVATYTHAVDPAVRLAALASAGEQYRVYLHRCRQYNLLSPPAAALAEVALQQDEEEGGGGGGSSSSKRADPATLRHNKIEKFKRERAIKGRIEELEQRQQRQTGTGDGGSFSFQPHGGGRSGGSGGGTAGAGAELDRDAEVEGGDADEAERELWLLHADLAALQAAERLGSLHQEVEILQHAAAMPEDQRQRQREQRAAAGPPADLMQQLGAVAAATKRQQLGAGVFRPSHALPTMSVEQFGEVEYRRMMEEQQRDAAAQERAQRAQAERSADDVEDEEVQKARAWDDFKDDNPRGWGNSKLRPCA